MESTTKLRTHVLGSGLASGRGVTIHRRSVAHAQWLYKSMRKEGLNPADARMSLVFALAAGQRDARVAIEQALRELG